MFTRFANKVADRGLELAIKGAGSTKGGYNVVGAVALGAPYAVAAAVACSNSKSNNNINIKEKEVSFEDALKRERRCGGENELRR